MPTKLSVMNECLRLLGEPAITTPNQDVERARQVNGAWYTTVEYCFQKGRWNFAQKRAILARSNTAPEFGFPYYYVKPADCVKIVFISDTGIEGDDYGNWQEEGGFIASDAEAIYLKYISRAYTDLVGAWWPVFADWVSAELAMRVGPRLRAKDELYQVAKNLKDTRESDALGFDASQSPPRRPNPGRWVRARMAMGPSRFGRDGRS